MKYTHTGVHHFLALVVVLSAGCGRVEPYKVPKESGVPYLVDRNEDRDGDGISVTEEAQRIKVLEDVEQCGNDQPGATTKSKPSGEEKTKPESEAHSQ